MTLGVPVRHVASPTGASRRTHPYLRRRALATVMGIALLAGCATTGTSTEQESSGKVTTLTIATSFDIDDLDPLKNGFWGPEFGYVELLMRPQRDGTPTPWVLKELSQDGDRAWKLTLNEGVTFENGRKFDAAALVELLTFSAKENAGFAAAAAVAKVAATGENEVTLSTSRPVPDMPAILADEANVPVFDVAAYRQHLEAKAPPANLVQAGLYTGPYQVTSLDGQRALLKANPSYWDGTPALESITIKFVPEATARIQAVQTGEADIALYMPTSAKQSVEGSANAHYVTGEPTGSTFAFTMNNARPPYNDAMVRKAANAAIDYKALADDVMDGMAGVAESIFPGDLPYAVKTQRTDLDEARRLLDEAGWVAGSDGVRTKGGQRLTMSLLCYPQQPDSIKLAEAMQHQLGQVGFAVQVRQVDDLTAERKAGKWDGALAGNTLISFGRSPIGGLATDLKSDGSANFGKVNDARLDELINKLQATFDKPQQEVLLRDIQQVIHDGGYFAATVARNPGVVTNTAWRGYELPISNLWVSAKTAP